MILRNLFVLAAAITMAACAQESSAPAEAETATGGSVPTEVEAAVDMSVIPNLAEVTARVAEADPDMGKRQYMFCQACHTTNQGGANKVGPNLSGVIDRSAGQAEGFVYSEALSASDLVWDLATLDSWLESPNRLVPHTTMIFGGIRDPQQRAHLIAYLEVATSTEAAN